MKQRQTPPAPRKRFDFREFQDARKNLHEANRVLFEWLADDADRAELYKELKLRHRGGLEFPSRVELDNDPAPPIDQPPFQGHRPAYLIANRQDIAEILGSRDGLFSNRPYRAIGSGSFMLGLDPTPAPDWHAKQREAADAALNNLGKPLDRLRQVAIDHASVISLARRQFDLAEFAEQIALRYCGLLFGFASGDHALLHDAMAKSYRALNYQMMARHFVSEPDTLAIAHAAMAKLARRADELMHEYDMLKRYPERKPPPYDPRPERYGWPDGVDPPSYNGLDGLTPLLKAWASDRPSRLSGQQRATMAVGMLAGIVGNVQASVCIAVDDILHSGRPPDPEDGAAVERHVAEALAGNPPAPFLPRYALEKVTLGHSGLHIPAGSDLLLCIGAASEGPAVDARPPLFDPVIFGLPRSGVHWCIGAYAVWPLIVHTVQAVLKLPGLGARIDPVTGETLRLEKRWGFGCERYPLHYRRDRRIAQQPLQVVMRIKSPVTENAARLRQVIRDGAPKVERALREARHVHFAWFQLIENETHLALQTVYDGDFDAYILHFALKVDDVFDSLFEYIEDAPPLPVRDFPEAFVDVIRFNNRAPVGGYFFSAYPNSEVWQLQRVDEGARP